MAPELKIIIIVLSILVAIGMYVTSPSQYPECQGKNVPRFCVN